MVQVVLPALIPDIPKVYDVYFNAFHNDQMGRIMLEILFPGVIDDDFKKAHAAGTLAYWHTSGSQYTFKCVDTATGDIIGMALGDVYLTERTEEERKNHGVPWLIGEQRERAEKILNPLWEVRERLFGGKRYIYCHVIGIDPKHQGRKAGALLVQWGIDLGERAGLPVYFESSPSTVGLYKKMGFELLDEKIIHKAEVLGTEEDIEVPLMVKMPSLAGGMSFAEWKATDYPEFRGYALFVLWAELRLAVRAAIVRRQAIWFGSSTLEERTRNIVIIGASFAGYRAAQIISKNLSPRSDYRVVVIEPNSHFQFTWVLPRFCVVKGHEHKAFIPYGGYMDGAPEGSYRWVKDRVTEIDQTTVKLQDSDEAIPYEFLVIATGSGVKDGLPSRVNATDKREGMRLLQGMQNSIESAKTVVVVGGGAAGVEVATDAKALYPEKHIILVHSRDAVMHRFGKGLQIAAREGLERLGVELILEERVVDEDAASGTVTLKSGRKITCDFFMNCTGQRPLSDVIVALSPNSISSTGHIKVKSTLQIADDALPNVYTCGDVAETKTPNPNSRSAMRQATVVADNILLAVGGKKPSYIYENFWADGVIKLTLGLDRSVTHLGDGNSELLFPSKETDDALMSAMCWSRMGEKPFEDKYMDAPAAQSEAEVSKV
ncbi:apoptosis-inducing factor [Trichoderma arundinaceum]|uniref:Apoptosis-inducing factor n=1 Tax=Trichoderma arundinaceum TaxID=490622 RepID=A0A395NSN6_TRIAR|nr:apoptosis-inducing factor [Trichoderma arundinaceum]